MTLAQLTPTGSGIPITLRFSNIEERFTTKTTVLDIPGKDADMLQSMGKKYRIFSVKGLYIGSGRATDRETLRELLNTNATFSSEGIPSMSVFIKELQWRERGSRPLEYDVEMDLVEIT